MSDEKTVPTMLVKRKKDGVECRINVADFDKSLHDSMEADSNKDGKLTVAEIKKRLDELEIVYDSTAKKPELEDMLAEAEAKKAADEGSGK